VPYGSREYGDLSDGEDEDNLLPGAPLYFFGSQGPSNLKVQIRGSLLRHINVYVIHLDKTLDSKLEVSQRRGNAPFLA